MFSLDDSHRYWFYNSSVNMCLGFNGLSSIVTNRMGMNLCGVDVFVFVSVSRMLIPGDSRPPIPVILGHPC